MSVKLQCVAPEGYEGKQATRIRQGDVVRVDDEEAVELLGFSPPKFKKAASNAKVGDGLDWTTDTEGQERRIPTPEDEE